MSRLRFTTKNIFFGYVSNIVSTILGFISRTIFIHILGVAYLGVNGLFTNVLGVLSFAELGIGAVMNYSLYKPIAQKDTERIKSLLNFYKIAYRIIALVVTVIGIAVLPFLKYIVKDPGDIGNISVYYIIYLFNTVSSYFIVYKFSLVNAEQKKYIFSNIKTITSFVMLIFHIIILLIFKSFLAHLLVTSIVQLVRNVFINIYINKKYPYLLNKNAKKLTKEELKPIKKNVIALVWHKIGDVSVYQTDSIIISAFVSITTVGIISNYNLIMSAVSGFITIIFSSTRASLGNLVATESTEKQIKVFKVYNFINFWIYGFASIAFLSLTQGFITLWIGSDKLIDNVSLILICLNYYFLGQRIAFFNFKTAFGVFYDDQYVALTVAVINLALSIVLVNIIGLPGIYIGTLLSGLYQSIKKPLIAYKRMTGLKAVHYFTMFIKYLGVLLIAVIPTYIFTNIYLVDINTIKFIVAIFFVIIVPNSIFFLVFRKTEEFKESLLIIRQLRSNLNGK